MRLRLFILFVASDQILKLLASKFFHPVSNTGIAFGIGENIPIISIIIVYLLLALLVIKSKSGLGEVLLFAGGAGNILDRLIYGKIVDWISLGSLWFNLADVYIAIGVGCIILEMIKEKRKKSLSFRA